MGIHDLHSVEYLESVDKEQGGPWALKCEPHSLRNVAVAQYTPVASKQNGKI